LGSNGKILGEPFTDFRKSLEVDLAEKKLILDEFVKSKFPPPLAGGN
jgi:hypothetical protein